MIAKQRAIADAKRFGMECTEKEIEHCDLPPVKLNNAEIFQDEEDIFEEMLEPDVYEFSDEEEESEELNDLFKRNLCLKDYSEKAGNSDGRSRFAQITDEQGFTKTVQKKAVVWLLSGAKTKLSSDRCVRVQNKPNRRGVRRSTSAPDFSSRLAVERVFRISDEIIIGQWCMFKKDLKKSKQLNVEHFLVGAITSFIYKTGKTQKEKQYTWESALIKTPNLQALATWYHISKKAEFIPVRGYNSYYVDVQNYFATIADPEFSGTNIFITNERLTHIRESLMRLKNTN